LIILLLIKQSLSEHIRVLIYILQSSLYQFLCQLLICTLMSQEVCLVIAVEGRPEVSSEMMRETQRCVCARGLGVKCQTLLIQLNRRVKVPIIMIMTLTYFIFL
jgi:hypothetical protein